MLSLMYLFICLLSKCFSFLKWFVGWFVELWWVFMFFFWLTILGKVMLNTKWFVSLTNPFSCSLSNIILFISVFGLILIFFLVEGFILIYFPTLTICLVFSLFGKVASRRRACAFEIETNWLPVKVTVVLLDSQ